tara:strand:- start:140 stop:445 length:306 start_codon:yes stop_codon:yes gene_type:complete
MRLSISYKFNEGEILKEIQQYVDGTYVQHYAAGQIQSTEFIIDAGHGEGFAIGNIIKYAQRYGKKNGFDKSDLLKVIHYAIIALSIHESKFPNRPIEYENK